MRINEAYKSVTSSRCGSRGVGIRDCDGVLNAVVERTVIGACARNIFKGRSISLVVTSSGAGVCLAMPELLSEAKGR